VKSAQPKLLRQFVWNSPFIMTDMGQQYRIAMSAMRPIARIISDVCVRILPDYSAGCALGSRFFPRRGPSEATQRAIT
jgi:hypothetical protein